MSIRVPMSVLLATTSKVLEQARHVSKNWNTMDREYNLPDDLSVQRDALVDILAVATEQGNTRLRRAVTAMIDFVDGARGKKIPSFLCAKFMLDTYLSDSMIDGWIYRKHHDGKMYPELIVGSRVTEADLRNDNPPTYVLATIAFSAKGGKYASCDKKYTFTPHMVSGKTPEDAFAGYGLYHETPELKAAYEKQMQNFNEVVRDGFAEQFFLTGGIVDANRSEMMELLKTGKGHVRSVVHDIEAYYYLQAEGSQIESMNLASTQKITKTLGNVPLHPIVHVFDIKSHSFAWAHADNMTPYVYDKSLRDKLVLPKSHRDLLDVLTTDLNAFVDDIIRGKSAGNIILCKGIPGVGKTLTAEVYAELIERPIISVHAGSLGVDVRSIREKTEKFFAMSKRWNAILLLDEADVFVMKRTNNLEANAIVAEFLRMLEYFSGLLFMTTNRPEDIDDAIISRCAAIIGYNPPCPEDAAKIWRVMAAQNKIELSDSLVEELIKTFPEIAPRDIKMLLRLVLRVCSAKGDPLDIDVFRKCAMFRAIKING